MLLWEHVTTTDSSQPKRYARVSGCPKFPTSFVQTLLTEKNKPHCHNVLIFGFSHRGVESLKSEYLMGSPAHYAHVLRRVVRNLWTENVSAFGLPISKPHARAEIQHHGMNELSESKHVTMFGFNSWNWMLKDDKHNGNLRKVLAVLERQLLRRTHHILQYWNFAWTVAIFPSAAEPNMLSFQIRNNFKSANHPSTGTNSTKFQEIIPSTTAPPSSQTSNKLLNPRYWVSIQHANGIAQGKEMRHGIQHL